MGHADFRVGGKIFATLGYPSAGFGTLVLSPEVQDLWRLKPARREGE